jgi:hypothetical protein
MNFGGHTPPAVQKTALDDRSRSIEYGPEITKGLLKMQEKSCEKTALLMTLTANKECLNAISRRPHMTARPPTKLMKIVDGEAST